MTDKCIKREINFYADGDGSWVMKLTSEGIFFNKDRYPDAKPDAFAEAVIKILEKQYKVRFEKNNPPYDRNKEASQHN